MRIRSIKPEFWVSESIGRLSREARLLFIGLWSFADDSGRARGAFAAISGALFPYDRDAVEQMPVWFAELEAEGMVVRYKADDGNTYYQLPNWLKHQKIEKPSASKIPPFAESSPKIRRLLPEPYPLEQGTGNREQGPMEQGEDLGASAPSAQEKPSTRFKPPTREELNLEAAKIGLPDSEVDKFVNHYASVGWKVGKNPMKSWPHALGGWKARWQERNHANSRPGYQRPLTGAEERRQLLDRTLYPAPVTDPNEPCPF